MRDKGMKSVDLEYSCTDVQDGDALLLRHLHKLNVLDEFFGGFNTFFELR